MRAIPTKYVEEGCVLGENLYTKDGQILIKKGVTLTKSLLKKISMNSIFTVYIEDVHSDHEVNRLIDQSLRIKGMMIVKTLFKMAKDGKSIDDLHYILSSYAEDVLYELKSYKKQNIEYIDIKNVDNYIYSSALNVALISSLIAWDLGYNDDMVKHTFLGAIYHDIGVALLPDNIVNKRDELTRDEKLMIINHPNRGYAFVKEKTYLSGYVKQIVLQHHECIDGSGYPQRLIGNSVSKLAQIVGIANIYDAMTSDRPYKRAVPPNEALEYLMGSTSKYDQAIISTFMRRITPYPIGSHVLLSNDKIAIVDEINNAFPLRPKGRIIFKNSNKYKTVNLMKESTITIKKISYDMN